MPRKRIDFTVETAPALEIDGVTGWNWLVRDRWGRVPRVGWSAGRRRDALQDATSAIAELVAQREANAKRQAAAS